MTEEKEPTKFLFVGYGMRDHEKVNRDISQASLSVWDISPADE